MPTMDTRRRCAALLGAGCLLIGVLQPAAGAATKPAPPKVGGVCAKAWQTAQAGAKRLVCAKSAKGLRWKLDTAAPDTTKASSAAPTTVVAGASTGATATVATAAGRTGALKGVMDYRAAGTVRLTTTGGVTKLVFVSAAIQNGPALAVYLTPKGAATDVTGAVKLGPLKSQTGDFEYEVPAGTDATAFSGVVIWCDKFGVAFGTATLA